MATGMVEVKNGKFIGYEGRYLQSLTETSFEANGWTGTINEDGSIWLEASRTYSNGVNNIRVTIYPNGYHKVTRKLGDDAEIEVLSRGFLVKNGEKLNGKLGLAGGNIADRYFFYRNTEWIDFLKSHGITAVKKESPNQEFVRYNGDCGCGFSRFYVFTDGKQVVSEEIDFGNIAGGAWRKVSVADATWTIVAHRYSYDTSAGLNVVLYTTEDPRSLALPVVTGLGK